MMVMAFICIYQTMSTFAQICNWYFEMAQAGLSGSDIAQLARSNLNQIWWYKLLFTTWGIRYLGMPALWLIVAILVGYKDAYASQ